LDVEQELIWSIEWWTNQKRDYFFLMSKFTRPVMGFSSLAFGRLGPVVASWSRLVVGSHPLAMSLSCAFTTSLTLAASAYDIFGIFGLTAKQPLLSTTAVNVTDDDAGPADAVIDLAPDVISIELSYDGDSLCSRFDAYIPIVGNQMLAGLDIQYGDVRARLPILSIENGTPQWTLPRDHVLALFALLYARYPAALLLSLLLLLVGTLALRAAMIVCRSK
jgi:hypothetical protein